MFSRWRARWAAAYRNRRNRLPSLTVLLIAAVLVLTIGILAHNPVTTVCGCIALVAGVAAVLAAMWPSWRDDEDPDQ
jgi:uncharacterized membrane protein HdeD (DUF308 family)